MKVCIISFLVLLALLLAGCPDGQPVKPDPCAGKKPVTAEFKVYQILNDYRDKGKDFYYLTDTVMDNNFVLFEASGNYDLYEWQLGDDPSIKTGKSVKYKFNDPWGKLPMRLIVKGKPKIDCFPDDDGVDTVYKNIYVIDKRDAAILGSYIGYHTTDTLDTFTVDIVYDTLKKTSRGLIIYNINKGCFLPDNWEANFINLDYGNKLVIFDGGGGHGFGCYSPSGIAILQSDLRTITIEYQTTKYDPPKPYEIKKYTFIGVKK